jgi:hypothetical protein
MLLWPHTWVLPSVSVLNTLSGARGQGCLPTKIPGQSPVHPQALEQGRLPPQTFSWYWRREESSDWMSAVAWPMNMA